MFAWKKLATYGNMRLANARAKWVIFSFFQNVLSHFRNFLKYGVNALHTSEGSPSKGGRYLPASGAAASEQARIVRLPHAPMVVTHHPYRRWIMAQMTCSRCRESVHYFEDLVHGALSCPGCGEHLADFAGAKSSTQARSSGTATIAPPKWEVSSAADYTATGRTKVTLCGQNERVTDSLPSVCMCCGGRATNSKEKKFIWYPRWIYLLLPIGGLPFLIAMLLSQKKMTVRIPVCDRHRRPWLGMQLFAAFTLVYLLVLPWFLIYMSVQAEKIWGRGNPWSLVLLGGWFVGIAVLCVLMFLLRLRYIHVKRITADTISLGGVSEAFAERVQSGGRRW
jgi:hypothetical protein